jgi:hypothetical protein
VECQVIAIVADNIDYLLSVLNQSLVGSAGVHRMRRMSISPHRLFSCTTGRSFIHKDLQVCTRCGREKTIAVSIS